MKSLVFDASTIITISMNGLLDLIKPMKKMYNGKFYVPKAVQREIIDQPLNTKRFKLEGLRVLDIIKEGYIELYEGNSDFDKLVKELLWLSNHIYEAKGNYLVLIQEGEISALAGCLMLNADALVVDERTLRMMIEDPRGLSTLLSDKLHTNITINDTNLNKFKSIIKDIKIIRSSEILIVAYEKGLLNDLISKEGEKLVDVNLKKELLDALLWGLKLKGCAISVDEIMKVMKLEGF